MNIKGVTCFFFFLTVMSSVYVSGAAGPTDVLRPTLTQIAALIDDQELAGDEHKDERRANIMAVVSEGFDFAEMAKRTVGRTWKSVDKQQRAHFVELFTKLLENAYIGKLESYTGTTTEYVGEKIKGSKAKVSTILNEKGAAIPVNYIMLKKGAVWKVYDINIEGVSLVRNYREQFKSILRKNKFDGLVKTLEEKNAGFAAE